jgi:hypothetical protein
MSPSGEPFYLTLTVVARPHLIETPWRIPMEGYYGARTMVLEPRALEGAPAARRTKTQGNNIESITAARSAAAAEAVRRRRGPTHSGSAVSDLQYEGTHIRLSRAPSAWLQGELLPGLGEITGE